MTSNESVIVSLISAASGIIVAYIVNVASKRVQKKKLKEGPVDRMEQMFDGYERLIKQKDMEDERKARLMTELEEELVMTREMVRKLEHALSVSQQDLDISRRENRELKQILEEMREEYKKETLEEKKHVVQLDDKQNKPQ